MAERLLVTKSNLRSAIQEAAPVLKKGGLVIYPTDTLYGLGCDALNEEAIKKVFAAKGRGEEKPLPIAVSGLEMMRRYAIVTPEAEALAAKFLPGALTMVLMKKGLPGILTSGREDVAVRIPDSEVTIQLVTALGRPITATSANLTGKEPPVSADEAVKQVDADLVLDVGRLGQRVPSTIVDLTGSPKLLREGKIKWAEIEKVLSESGEHDDRR